MIEPGEHFGGPHNERRIVRKVEAGVVYYHYPLLGEASSATATEAEFQEWKDELDA